MTTVLLCSACALWLGCATPSASPRQPVDLSAPGWTIRHGQAVWHSQPEGDGIAGELMVAMHQDGRSVIEFSKNPLPIVTARVETNGWEIRFAAENKTYSGRGSPPDRLLWLQLPDGIIGRNTSTNWYFARTRDEGWHFESLVTEESLDGFLSTTKVPDFHVVREGETVNRIARTYGIDPAALREANPGASLGWIRAGNIIRLPNVSARQP